jgi:hypothetical protein
VYVDRYGNGKGRDGHVKRERVWRVGRAPRGGWGKEEEVGVHEGASLAGKIEGKTGEKREGRDDLKELLGLDTMPVETGPPKTGVAAASP